MLTMHSKQLGEHRRVLLLASNNSRPEPIFTCGNSLTSSIFGPELLRSRRVLCRSDGRFQQGHVDVVNSQNLSPVRTFLR